MATPPTIICEQRTGTIGNRRFVYGNNQYSTFEYENPFYPYPAHHHDYPPKSSPFWLTWTTQVNQRLWWPMAKRLRIAPFHAFQRVNFARYHKNLPITLVPQ